MMAMSGESLSYLLSAMRVCLKCLHLSLSSIPELEERFLVERLSSIMISILLLSLKTSTILALDAYLNLLCQSLI